MRFEDGGLSRAPFSDQPNDIAAANGNAENDVLEVFRQPSPSQGVLAAARDGRVGRQRSERVVRGHLGSLGHPLVRPPPRVSIRQGLPEGVGDQGKVATPHR